MVTGHCHCALDIVAKQLQNTKSRIQQWADAQKTKFNKMLVNCKKHHRSYLSSLLLLQSKRCVCRCHLVLLLLLVAFVDQRTYSLAFIPPFALQRVVLWYLICSFCSCQIFGFFWGWVQKNCFLSPSNVRYVCSCHVVFVFCSISYLWVPDIGRFLVACWLKSWTATTYIFLCDPYTYMRQAAHKRRGGVER